MAIPDIHAVIDRAVAAAATQDLSARLQVESTTQEQNEEGSATPALAATVADLVVIDGV